VEFKSTPLVTAVDLPAGLWAQVEAVCKSAYHLVGMRDYGRVDLRVTPEGRAYVLEVNPNPYLNSKALVDGLSRVGRSFPEFVRSLVRDAIRRSRRPESG